MLGDSPPRTIEQRISSAVQMVRSERTYRFAAEENAVPHSTIHSRMTALRRSSPLNRRSRGRATALSRAEEGVIVSLLQRYADRGIPLRRQHLKEAVAIIVSQMSPSRQMGLPFKDGSPGEAYLRAFTRRHKDALKFSRPLRREAVRFRACNAEVFATHLAAIEKLIKNYSIDQSRIWNCDETGATPGRDCNGKDASRVYLTRGGVDAKIGNFLNANRVTILLAISGAGDTAPPLFVFKATRLPYRCNKTNGVNVFETYADCLPRGSLIGLREDVVGVDSKNFLLWATHFFKHVADLTHGGCKVLLILDGYRSHMSLPVLELLNNNNVIVYALPAHTSWKTQPLDVTVFAPFKAALNEAINLAVSRGEENNWDTFVFCRMLQYAYKNAFTVHNITTGFRKSGLWPFNYKELLSTRRPKSSTEPDKILTVNELEENFEHVRRAMRSAVLGDDATVGRSGFVDTARGAVLTPDRALALVREKDAADRVRRVAGQLKAARLAEKAAKKKRKAQAEAERMREAAWGRRAEAAGVPLDLFRSRVRSIEERRAAARGRTARRQQFGMGYMGRGVGISP